MKNHFYIACDLGAESGRVMLGRLADGRLQVEEIHRFANTPVKVGDTLRWDVGKIATELQTGLRKVAALQAAGTEADEPAAGEPVTASLSVDSWGVDYVLMRNGEPLTTTPYHYRDTRTAELFDNVMTSERARIVFDETGLQFLSLNTLYQFLAEKQEDSTEWQQADQFLLIADYFLWQFSGVAGAEASLASTTQLYNPQQCKWSDRLQKHFEFPASLFPPVVPSGTVLGELTSEIATATGLTSTEVIATCSHDTGAAVAAVPASGDDWAYLSSGTWSLLGAELNEPLINEAVREAGFTNEVGFNNTIRLLKNIVGLWIVQECRRHWASEGQEWDYATLTHMAIEALPLRSLIRPNDARFALPGEMPGKVASFCHETGQEVPLTAGQTIRCVLESLALSYRQTLEELEGLTGKKIQHLHIVGGGSRNAQLNQWTANATGLEVLAGPTEATAIGNILLQAAALGHLENLRELREIVRESFPPETYHPQDIPSWQSAYDRFTHLNPTV
jgi:rhamnulokinase